MFSDAHPYIAVIGLLVIFLLGVFPAFYGTSVWLAFLFSFLGCPAPKDAERDLHLGDAAHEPV
jgi:hypothetical protein